MTSITAGGQKNYKKHNKQLVDREATNSAMPPPLLRGEGMSPRHTNSFLSIAVLGCLREISSREVIMPATALKQRTYHVDAVQGHAGAATEAQSWQVRRLSIAMEAEAASNIAGNILDVDYEMFLCAGGKYKVSDFA
jgi:hypothetical protein